METDINYQDLSNEKLYELIDQKDIQAIKEFGRRLKNVDIKNDDDITFKYVKLGTSLDDAFCLDRFGSYFYYGIKKSKCDECAYVFYKLAAEKGLASAKNHLGVCLLNGIGIEQDVIGAIKLFKEASAENDMNANFYLACAYNKGDYIEKDYKKAFEHYSRAAQLGHERAGLCMAIMYMNGTGTTKDTMKGMKIITKLAKQGYKLAEKYTKKFKLFPWELADTDNEEEDFIMQVSKYIAEAKEGKVEAQIWLAKYYENIKSEKEERAFFWWGKAAVHNNPAGLYGLAYCYLRGYGTPQDVKKSIELLKKSAEMGLSKAMNMLGNIYLWGLVDGHKDYASAYHYFKLSADNDSAHGYQELAIFYHNGFYVEKNEDKAKEMGAKVLALSGRDLGAGHEEKYKQAYKIARQYEKKKDLKQAFEYYKIASQYRYYPALIRLGICYYEGRGTKKNPQEAIKIWKEMEFANTAELNYNLGRCYFEQNGLRTNYKTAYKYFSRSAAQGYNPGKYYLAICLLDAKGVKRDRNKAITLLEELAKEGFSNAKIILVKRKLDNSQELKDFYTNHIKEKISDGTSLETEISVKKTTGDNATPHCKLIIKKYNIKEIKSKSGYYGIYIELESCANPIHIYMPANDKFIWLCYVMASYKTGLEPKMFKDAHIWDIFHQLYRTTLFNTSIDIDDLHQKLNKEDTKFYSTHFTNAKKAIKENISPYIDEHNWLLPSIDCLSKGRQLKYMRLAKENNPDYISLPPELQKIVDQLPTREEYIQMITNPLAK